MMQYAAFTDRINGDSFNTAFTTDKAKAFRDAGQELYHLTASERRKCVVSVQGWDVPEGMTFEEWTEDMIWNPDPAFYEIATVD